MQFLKDNGLMLAGLALPALVALIFFASTQIARSGIAPPEYSVLFAVDAWPDGDPYDFVVADGGLALRYTPPDESNPRNRKCWKTRKPRLLLFDPQDKSVQEIALPEITQEHARAPRWP